MSRLLLRQQLQPRYGWNIATIDTIIVTMVHNVLCQKARPVNTPTHPKNIEISYAG